MTTAIEPARALRGIRFAFDERRARAAASVLLKDHGGRMPYLRLIKLLYLADRESLLRRGRPIVGGRYVAMKYGPVLSEVLDLVRRGGDVWSEAVEKDEFDVFLKGEPDLAALSDEEIGLLREASALHATLDRWKLCDLTHAFPEWKDPGSGTLDISPEDILRALGKTDEALEEVRQEAQERAYFDDLLGR